MDAVVSKLALFWRRLLSVVLEKDLVRWIKPESILKMAADGILINISIVTSLVVRLLWIIAYSPQANIDYTQTLWNYWRVYTDSTWLLTLISLAVFSLNGFYTSGRFYRGRYKPLVIVQAVSLAYLVFGALTYLSQGIFFDFKPWLRLAGMDICHRNKFARPLFLDVPQYRRQTLS